MTHTPGLLHVIEQNERDKDARCVRLVDSNGVFALVIDEKYGERFAALWNMAERLGLSTEEIESGNVETKIKAAPDMLRALEAVCGDSEESDYLMQAQIQAMCRSAIRKARGEG